jgi:hypothetical protein
MNPTVARAVYLNWLRTNFPDLYNDAVGANAASSAGVGGFFDTIGTTFSNVVSSVTNALPNLANTYAQYKSSESLIKMNNERAKQGLVPLQSVNGQLVPVGGQYEEQDYMLAQTGISTPTAIMLVAGVALVLYLALRK